MTDVGLNVSAGFVDEDLWRAIEPGTPAPQRRLDACAALNDAGLRCGVLMGPIVPYLSDSPGQLEAAVRQAAAAGAAHVSPIVLHLRPGAREWFLGWLREAHPALVPRYAELYGRGAYARQEYRSRIIRRGPRAHGTLWRRARQPAGPARRARRWRRRGGGGARRRPRGGGGAADGSRRRAGRRPHHAGRRRGGRARAARALLTIDQHRSKLNKNALPASNHLRGKWMAPADVWP